MSLQESLEKLASEEYEGRPDCLDGPATPKKLVLSTYARNLLGLSEKLPKDPDD